MGFKSIDNWTKKHTTEEQGEKESNSNMDVAEGQQDKPLNDRKQEPIILTSQPVEITVKICPPLKEPVKTREITDKNDFSQEHVSEKVLKTERTEESQKSTTEADSSKKASELIAFFDTSQKDKATKTKSNKKAEKLQTRNKQEATKIKNKDVNSKTTLNKTKDSEKAQKSQNRKSFPFNITKLTKAKSSDKRRSVPKANLPKAKSCEDLLREQKNDEICEQKPRHSSHVEEEQKKDLEDLNKKDGSKIVDSELSELSAELSAALAAPPQKLVEINMSRDYLLGNGDVSKNYRSLTEDNEKGIIEYWYTSVRHAYHINTLKLIFRANREQQANDLSNTLTYFVQLLRNFRVQDDISNSIRNIHMKYSTVCSLRLLLFFCSVFK